MLEAFKRIDLSDQSVQRLAELMARFTGYVERGHGLRAVGEIAEEHVEGFVFASILGTNGKCRPSSATMHLRRSALRLYFRMARQLGTYDGDPTADLILPPRSSLPVRPLTDDEVALCRSYSLKTLVETRQPAAWALAEATARTSEIPHIRISDLHIKSGRVWIHGASKADPRWGHLSAWGAKQIARRIDKLAASGGDPSLVYGGTGSEQSRQASSCIAIAETLQRAGLTREPDVRPSSIVGWAGRKIFEQTGRIDLVARRLGARSLDRAARLIGWEWGEEEGRAEGVSP